MGYYSRSSSSGIPLVCHLNKSIYGLKQASRQWFTKFSTALLNYGFSQSKADYYLFTLGSSFSFVALMVYVDDILIIDPSPDEIVAIKDLLWSHFQLINLGHAKYFLGLELSRTSQGLYLSERKYWFQILEDSGFLGSKLTTSPMLPNLKLSSSS